jgi:hypothetical protein
MAPPAPEGWSHSDSPKDNVLTEVCADGPQMTRWGFSRSYSRTGDEQQRLAATHQQVEAVAQRGLAARKANEAKIVEIDKQIDTATKKLQAAMAGKKYAEMETISAESQKLMDARGQTVVRIDGDTARVEALLKSATLR